MDQKPEQAKWLKTQADGTVEIDFTDCPIPMDGTEVKKLTMREPTVGDQLAVNGMATAPEREIAMIANLCEQAPDMLHKLTLRQYGRLQDAYASFID